MKKDKKKKAITQQNLEESREEILAKGKKFRYPFQYSKHRLVIITILILTNAALPRAACRARHELVVS